MVGILFQDGIGHLDTLLVLLELILSLREVSYRSQAVIENGLSAAENVPKAL